MFVILLIHIFSIILVISRYLQLYQSSRCGWYHIVLVIFIYEYYTFSNIYWLCACVFNFEVPVQVCCPFSFLFKKLLFFMMQLCGLRNFLLCHHHALSPHVFICVMAIDSPSAIATCPSFFCVNI